MKFAPRNRATVGGRAGVKSVLAGAAWLVLLVATPVQAAEATLDADTALTGARAVAAQIKDARVLAVTANSRMRAVFEENAYVITEPARADALRVGDIIVYRQPDNRELVVRRFLGHGDSLPAAGHSEVTGEPLRRVFAIIYFRGEASNVAMADAPRPANGRSEEHSRPVPVAAYPGTGNR